MLKREPQIKWVFYDQMSLYQGMNKTPEQRAEFSLMLPNINILYLACRVLILLDRAYISRFWTQFEAWLSFQTVSNAGLVGAPEGQRRNVIVPIHGAAPSLGKFLTEEWCQSTHDEAYERLSQPDVHITNTSDKDVQLHQLQKLNELVSRIVQRAKREAAQAVAPSARAKPPKSGMTSSRAARVDDSAEVAELRALFHGVAPPSAPAPTNAVAAADVVGLRELMEGLKLEGQLEAARSWCIEQGVESLADLKEADMVGELASALKLKPAKKKIYEKRVEALLAGKA